MTWAAMGAAAVGLAGSVGQGMLNKKSQKEGLKSSQQVIMTPEQKRMLRRTTGLTDMVLAGGQTPADIAAANAAQTEGQLALRDAVAQQEVMPGSGAMTPEMLAMLQGKALQGRVAGNVAVRNASYENARQAGLQIALGAKEKGVTGQKSASGYGGMADALGGVAQSVGLAIPTGDKNDTGTMKIQANSPTTSAPFGPTGVQLPGGTTTPDIVNDPKFKIKYGSNIK